MVNKYLEHFIFNLNINGSKKAKRWNATWAKKAQVGKCLSSLRKGAELEWGRSTTPPPLDGQRGGLSLPLWPPPLPSNLYILEDFHILDIQVLEPPLVLLALILVGPS